MVRRVVGVIVGFLVGFLCVAVVEGASAVVYPMPDGADCSDSEKFAEWVATVPIGGLLFVLAAHAIGAFAAGLVCVAIVRSAWLTGALILGTIFLAAGIANLVMIPHPVWFAVVDVVIYLPAAIVGAIVGGILFRTRRVSAVVAQAD